MAGGLSYVTNFGTLGAIHDGSTRFATTYTTGGLVVRPRIVELGNGTVVHYDGTGTAQTSPGVVSQEIFDKSGTTFINAAYAAQGQVGTLTMADSSTAQAILINVEDTSPHGGNNRSRVWVKLTWRIIGDWS